MLYWVAFFFVHYNIAYAFLHVHTGTHVVIERITPPCASFLHACRSKYLVCICREITKHMYFLAYLVCGFYSHLHLSSFNINTNIHMKGECKTKSVLKGRGAFIFLTKSCCYSDFCYNILDLESLNLIKIIHVPQSITMRVTPPCVLRAALFLPCVLRIAMFWPRILRTF